MSVMVDILIRIYRFFLPNLKKKNETELKRRFPNSVILTGATVDDSSIIGVGTVIHSNVEIINSIIGDYSYTLSNIKNTSIGKFCSIGPFCSIGLGKHPVGKNVSTHPAFYSTNNDGCLLSFTGKDYFKEYEKIEIGNDVWIGSNVIILDGIKIGDGAVIGAGSVVTKDVEPYSIVAGVPATIIRYRFSREQIDKLILIKWWEKDIFWIKRNAKDFLDIDVFLNEGYMRKRL